MTLKIRRQTTFRPDEQLTLAMVLLGCLAVTACSDGSGARDDGGTLDADAASLDDAAQNDASSQTDGATSGDADVSDPPVVPPENGPGDYTLFVDPSGNVTVYFRDASDDETSEADLEYEVRYQLTGSPEVVVLDFSTPAMITREAQNRMYVLVSRTGNAPGTHTVRVRVRDADGNVSDYEPLTHVVMGCNVCR